jgi:hypothetical protein
VPAVAPSLAQSALVESSAEVSSGTVAAGLCILAIAFLLCKAAIACLTMTQGQC